MMDKRTILVTGANGQLGRELIMLEQDKFHMIGLSREELDITDLQACYKLFRKYSPYAVIHCAAYTAVDKAESEQDEAFRVNEDGTRNVAIAAEEVKAKLIYVSTDYVFNGSSSKPYEVTDQVEPRTVYGASKLAGEKAVQACHSKYFIVRTSWVFGRYGNNFVKTMLQLSKQGKPLKVVADQIGSPTYTLDLAKLLLEMAVSEQYGTYHASNTGVCSWFDFAVQIFEESSLKVEVNPCSTEEFPRPAPRPAYSVMAHTELVNRGFVPLRSWQEALKEYLAQIS